MSRNYEFTDAQNKVIANLAKNVRFVGIAIFVCILLTIVILIFDFSMVKAVLILDILVWILIGAWHFKASKELTKIVDTEGHDIKHLMKAIRNFSAFYFLYYWAFILWIFTMVLSSIIFISSKGS